MQIHQSAYSIPIPTTINPPQFSYNVYIKDDDDDDEFFERIPIGYRFRPTEVELINEYLLKKIKNERLPRSRIHEVRLYGFDPETLAEKYKATGKNEWYFFTPTQRKYKNGSRPNRAAGNGFWKATGADKIITHNGEKIGYRKSLLYHEGNPRKSERTSWLMHEYRVEKKSSSSPIQTTEHEMKLDDWVLCRIYINPKDAKRTKKAIESIQREEEGTNEGNTTPLLANQTV